MEGLVSHPNIWGGALSVAQQVTGASVVHLAKAVLYRERCNVRKRTLSQKEMNWLPLTEDRGLLLQVCVWMALWYGPSPQNYSWNHSWACVCHICQAELHVIKQGEINQYFLIIFKEPQLLEVTHVMLIECLRPSLCFSAVPWRRTKRSDAEWLWIQGAGVLGSYLLPGKTANSCALVVH